MVDLEDAIVRLKSWVINFMPFSKSFIEGSEILEEVIIKFGFPIEKLFSEIPPVRIILIHNYLIDLALLIQE